jgi:hypothetical protein
MISNWNGIRLFRVIVGLAALIQGLLYRQYVLSVIGGVLLLQGVLNWSCCGVTCSVQKSTKNNNAGTEEMDYEEVTSVTK